MTNYYVKNGGNDGNTGLSDAQAWATIGKVNSINFANDDIIQLKRGSVFSDATLTLNSTSVGRSGIIIQDYGSGDKPRIDGNSVRPILINHALVNLALKNIDVSGSDTSGTRCHINHVNGLIIDGVDYNGHTGSSSYVRSTAMAVSYVDGDIEIKNCTLQNVMKDTTTNTLAGWGTNDAGGLIMYYSGDANVKTTGTINIHDNTICNIYSDCIQLGGIHTQTNVYGNTFGCFGEQAIDIKFSRYVDFYENEIYHNCDVVKAGSYTGPSGIGSGFSTNWTSVYRARDNIIRDNYFHDIKFTAIAVPGADAIIKNNLIDNCFSGISIAYTSPKIYNNVFNLTSDLTDIEPYASNWIGTRLSGIRVSYTMKNDVLIYNNTFYISSPDHLYGIAVQADADVTGTIIKNNIIYMTQDSASVFPLYIQDYDDAGNLPTVENNNLYGVHSNRVRIEETPGNWVTYDSTEQAAWRTAGHAGALFTDPVFVNANDGDLALQSSSPTINKGTDLGSPYNLGLNPTSAWPHSVKTLNQYDYGTGWEIGAFVFTDAIETPAKGIIVNLDYPKSAKHGETVDINAATENIGSLPGLYKMEIWRNGVLAVTSILFTLSGGETSTDKIDPFAAPASGEAMNIEIKCVRITL